MTNVVEFLFLISLCLPPLAVVAGGALLAWPTADRTRPRPVASEPPVERRHVTAA